MVMIVTNLSNKVLRDMGVVEVMEVVGKGTVDLLFISGSCSIKTVLERTAYFGGGLDDDYDENGSALLILSELYTWSLEFFVAFAIQLKPKN